MIYGTQRSLADIIGPQPEPTWRIDMPDTLDAGGSGLGRDSVDADTAELNKWDILYPALKENQELREAVLRIEGDVAALHTSLQWRTWFIAVAYIVGFLSCAALTWFGAEALR